MDDGFCTFPDGRLQPPEQALAEGLCLVPGVNSVRFEIRCVTVITGREGEISAVVKERSRKRAICGPLYF